MAEVVRIQDNHNGFFDVITALFRSGKIQSSRNGNTLEVEDLVIEVSNPVYNSPEGVRPGYNASIGYVEGLQLLAGISDSGLTAEIQPQFRAYMDDGKFWGAYGPRTRDQFPIIAERLVADQDTRQAVITLWDPEFDAQGGKKDHPCTAAFFFLVRNGRLNMKTVMRSMDLWWGWPYDAVQFSMVHQAMASVIGVPVGTYTHHAVSAHLYEPHWDVAQQTIKDKKIHHGPISVLNIGVGANSWTDIRMEAETILRTVTGTEEPSKIKTRAGRHAAAQLFERRQTVIQKNYEKLISL